MAFNGLVLVGLAGIVLLNKTHKNMDVFYFLFFFDIGINDSMIK